MMMMMMMMMLIMPMSCMVFAVGGSRWQHRLFAEAR